MKRFLSELLGRKTAHEGIQLFRYLLVSVAASFVDFASLFLLTETLGIHYLVSAAAGYALGIIVNYALSVTWVFSSRKYKNVAVEFTFFVVIGIAGMGLNELCMWFFTEIVLLYFMISKAISSVIGFTTKYYARKKFLFV